MAEIKCKLVARCALRWWVRPVFEVAVWSSALRLLPESAGDRLVDLIVKHGLRVSVETQPL